MHLTLVEKIIWSLSLTLTSVLMLVLTIKRRYRVVPVFTAYIAFQLTQTLALVACYLLQNKHAYAITYWTCAFADVALQIAVVLEVASIVLRRYNRWVPGVLTRIWVYGAISFIVATLLAAHMQPAVRTSLEDYEARASLFTTVLVFLLVASIVAASKRGGVGWNNWAIRVSVGMFFWVTTSFVTGTLSSYVGTLGHFLLLQFIQIIGFQGSLIYWAIAFWLPEKRSAVMSESDMVMLEQLRKRSM